MASIGDTISKGANDFLMAEYFVMGGFMTLMAIIIFIAVDIVGNGGEVQFFTTIAFSLGAIISVVSGWIGMKIAVYANSRTAYVAIDSLADAFSCAF
jgi:Na+/H+-translocating membrane pyrophosphatase